MGYSGSDIYWSTTDYPSSRKFQPSFSFLWAFKTSFFFEWAGNFFLFGKSKTSFFYSIGLCFRASLLIVGSSLTEFLTNSGLSSLFIGSRIYSTIPYWPCIFLAFFSVSCLITLKPSLTFWFAAILTLRALCFSISSLVKFIRTEFLSLDATNLPKY